MSLKVDQVQLQIILKSDTTRAEIIKLEDQAKQLESEWKKLKKSGDDALAMDKKTELDATRKKIDDLRNSIDLNGRSMRELQQQSKQLQLQLNNMTPGSEKWQEINTELTAVKNRMSELRSASGSTAKDLGGNMNNMASSFSSFISAAKNGDVVGMIPALGKYAAVVGVVAGALGFAKEVMMSTRATSKEFKATIEGLESSWSYLLKSIAKGDFSFQKMIDAFNAGHQFKLDLSEITKEQQALTVEEAKNFNKIQELLEVQRNVNKTVKERKEAGDEILRITIEEGKTKSRIATDEYNSYLKNEAAKIGVTKENFKTWKSDFERFTQDYNSIDAKAQRERIKSFGTLMTNFSSNEAMNKEEMKKAGLFDAYDKLIKKGYSAQLAYKEATNSILSDDDRRVKKFYDTYSKTTNEEIDELVKKQVAAIKVPGEVMEATQRVRRTNHKLEKDMMDEINKKVQERVDAEKKLLDQQQKARDSIVNDTQLKIEIETKEFTDRLKNAGLFENDLTKLTEEQLKEREKLEFSHYQNISKILVDAENKRFENAKKDSGVTDDPSKLEGEKLKAYELIVKQHELNLTKITTDESKKRVDWKKQIDDDISKAINTASKAEVDTIESVSAAKKHALFTDYQNRANGIISEKAYQDALEHIEVEALNNKMISQVKARDFLKMLGLSTLEADKAIAATQAQIDSAKLKGINTNEKDVQKIKLKYAKDTILGQYQTEMAALDKLHKDGQMSEQEYQQEIFKLKVKSAGKYVQEIQKLTQAGSEFVSALKDSETAKSQASNQKELSSLNELYNSKQITEEEFNKRKEKLQYDQAVKELDIQKKYADAEFAMKVANIGAATAMGIINAWSSSMTLGPIAGPIAAGLMTALLVGTAAAQVSAANSERNRIKSMTIDSPASGSSTTSSTGARVVNQAADGRYNVVGAKDRKQYNGVRYAGRATTGMVTTPTLMGEAGTELVIDAPTLSRLNLKAPSFIPWVLANRVQQRADGKYDTVQNQTAVPGADNSAVMAALIQVMGKNNQLLDYLIANGVDAFVLLSQFEKAQALQTKSVSKGSLKG